MNTNQIKLFAIAVFALSFLAMIFSTNNAGTSSAFTISSQDDDSAAIYKKSCAVCHGAKAEKLFDLALNDDEHIEAILKGKKAAKPPHMPAYESKGITQEKAKDLVAFMRKLRNPEGENTDAKDAKEEAIEETKEKAREAIIAVYKKNCAFCHTAKAEKFYNPEMKEDEQVQIILKGKKAEKPPHMPGYEGKGITEKEAIALAAYMIELRTPGK
jgi:mono/diheme cytochrome c family protein